MTGACDQASQHLKKKQTSDADANWVNKFFPGSPNGIWHLSEALKECTVSSMLLTIHDKPTPTQQAQSEYLKSHLRWTAGTVREDLHKALGRCSLDFKASPSCDQRITKHTYLLSEAFACRHTESADPYDNELSIESMSTMYGTRFSMLEQAKNIVCMFNEWIIQQKHLHRLITTYNFLHGPTRGVQRSSMNVSDNITNLRTNVLKKTGSVEADVAEEFLTTVVNTYKRGTEAVQIFQEFKKAIDMHVESRVQSGKILLSYDLLGEDIVVLIAEFAGFKAACSLMRAHRDFYNCDNLKKLRPHIRIRTIEGHFPHLTAHVAGLGHVPVVCKSNLVAVVVDLAITGACRDGGSHSTKKATPWRGWFRDGLTFAEQRENRVGYLNDMRESEQRDFQDEDFVRLGSKLFFEGELSCKVQLVHADTHLPVDDSVHEQLKVARKCAKRNNCLHTFTAKDGVPYPAYCWYNAMKLTTNDQLKMYKFKVTATGMVKLSAERQSYQQDLVAYSRAFACVSTKRPFKRKLANPD